MKRREFIEKAAMAATLAGANPVLRGAQATNHETRPATVPAPEFFYRPQGAWAGDFIPFYKDGKFRLFYLLDWRDKHLHGE